MKWPNIYWLVSVLPLGCGGFVAQPLSGLSLPELVFIHLEINAVLVYNTLHTKCIRPTLTWHHMTIN